MPADHDARAVGAAVTKQLCGHWEHEPPCPVAPHHTSWSRDGDTVRIRVLFAAEPDQQAAVRAGVDQALSTGCLTGPGGVEVRWQVRTSGPGSVLPAERGHAARLAGT
jgi:hypothetical protein